ncbi:MAG TPA: glycosyl hydrolase 108 family protein [Bacteroidia bacterium]|jgi:lysozyme family protein|nr:glycosyl hydrolase 108 family protein [Bacteroidia bacterium]
MADFDKYYPILLKAEGGYASAEFAAKYNDKGGETYKGIARNFNPAWEGWAIIDAYKAKNGIPKWNSIIPDPHLDELAKSYSKKLYWDKLMLDQVQNQSVAEYFMDYGFNSGLGTATKAVQRIVGATVDGGMGQHTLDAIAKFDQKDLFNKLVNARVALIQNSPTISTKNKPGLIARAKSFVFVP